MVRAPTRPGTELRLRADPRTDRGGSALAHARERRTTRLAHRHRDFGDWHENGAWWAATYLNGEDQPDIAELWGRDGALEGVPGVPELHDVRPALAQIEHPAASDPSPVLCATVAQAILDLAWHELSVGGAGPGRREIVTWTDDTEEQRVRRLAATREHAVEDADDLAGWRAWQTRGLAGGDPFYISRPPLADPGDTRPGVNLVIDSGTRLR